MICVIAKVIFQKENELDMLKRVKGARFSLRCL